MFVNTKYRYCVRRVEILGYPSEVFSGVDTQIRGNEVDGVFT